MISDKEKEILLNPCCGNCKKARAQYEIIHNLKYVDGTQEKKKLMAYVGGIRKSKELIDYGGICIQCIYSKIGKRKAKLLKKIYPKFQSLDLFEPVEVEK